MQAAVKLKGRITSEGMLEVPKCPELSDSMVEVIIIRNELESVKPGQSIQWPSPNCGELLRRQIKREELYER